ncbi:MAG TPA: alkaline phosphatase family protein, partial [Candidatus Acidoferrales bacterium]|nr:alkaline phosphatase family protein [Candidatus Acidoferrales bacterium]
MTTRRTIAAALAFASAALSGCSSAAKSPSSVSLLPAQPGAAQPVGAYIKHVVIIIQENRTFDNVFRSYPGADSATTGKTSTGKTVTLQPIGFVKKDMIHDWQHAIIDWDKGKMDGFDQNLLTNRTSAGLFSYSYLGRQFVQPYWTMAQQYVLGDRMFATMFGQSYTAHLTLIAATADLKPNLSLVDDPSSQPWGCDAPLGTTVRTINARREFTTYAPFPCFTQFKTMEDTMDPKHVTWRYYQPQNSRLWSAFDSVRNVRFGPAWKANIGQSNT